MMAYEWQSCGSCVAQLCSQGLGRQGEPGAEPVPGAKAVGLAPLELPMGAASPGTLLCPSSPLKTVFLGLEKRFG